MSRRPHGRRPDAGRPARLPRTESFALLAPRGRCLASRVAELDGELRHALQAGAIAVVVDLTDLDEADEALVALLRRTHRQLAEQDGRLAVVPGAGAARRLFTAGGTGETLELHATRAVAIEALRPAALPELDDDGRVHPRLRVRATPQGAWIGLHGEWDVASLPELTPALEDVVTAGVDAEVDLSRCTFVDARTVGALLHTAARLAQSGRQLVVSGADPAVRRTLQLTGAADRLLAQPGVHAEHVVPEPLWALLARARSLQAEVVSARERSRGVRADARAAREAANRVRAVRPAASGRPPRADDLQRVLDDVRGMLQQLGGETSPGPAPAAGALGPGEPELLTRRQRQILGLLAEGLDTAAIAARLWLSRSTVRNHVTAILQALDAHSRLEAVAHARQRGLL